jgi:hypothetical protein
LECKPKHTGGRLDPNGGLIGFAEMGSDAQHIIYLSGGTVLEQFRADSGTSFSGTDLIQRASAPSPMMTGALAGHDFPEDQTIHVFYISTGLEVCELYSPYGSGAWFSNNLNAAVAKAGGQAPLASSRYEQPGMPLVSYVWPIVDKTQHVVYIGQDNSIYELWYVAKSGQWNITPVGSW